MPYATVVTFTFYKFRKSYWSVIFNVRNMKMHMSKMEWIDEYKNQERHLIYYNGIQIDYCSITITE